MTKAQKFQSDEGKRDILRTNYNVVIEALEALKEGLEANRVNAGVADPQVGNAYFQQIVGARHLIANLMDLTKAPSEVRQPEPRRLFTEADRELLKQQKED